MNEQRLNNLLQAVPNYQGSFAVNELDQVKIKYPTFLVVNLDDRNGKGTHWIGFAIYMKDVYICDSLGGIKPDKKISAEWFYFLKLISTERNVIITKQLSDSGLCGLFCVTFIKEMSRTNDFCDFITLFSSDLSTNDTVVKFLNKRKSI